MQQAIHEIFTTIGIIASLIDWTNVIPLLNSALSFGASLLNFFASKSAAEKEKVYLPPITVQSRRMPPRQQTRVRRRKHRSSI